MRFLHDLTFQQEMQFAFQRIARFPHHFVENVCASCGKHDHEIIGGGCVKAFDSHKLTLKVLQLQNLLTKGDLVELEKSLIGGRS